MEPDLEGVQEGSRQTGGLHCAVVPSMLILLVIWTKLVFGTLMLRFNREFFRCDTFKDYLICDSKDSQPHQSKVMREYLELFRRFLTLKTSKPLSEHESWVHVGWGQSHYMSDLLGNHPQLLKVHQPIDSGVIAWDGKNKREITHLRTNHEVEVLSVFYQRYLQDHKDTSALKAQSEELLVFTFQNKVASIVRLGYWRIFSYFLY